jgi:hypothetical protein
MDTCTSITYSIKKNNGEIVKKVEYNATAKDNEKIINTYYNNSVTNNQQTESFNKIFKDKNNTYEQIGSSKNKQDWSVQEYHNNNKQKEYVDMYKKHNFDQYIMECMPSLANLNDNFLIDNK